MDDPHSWSTNSVCDMQHRRVVSRCIHCLSERDQCDCARSQWHDACRAMLHGSGLSQFALSQEMQRNFHKAHKKQGDAVVWGSQRPFLAYWVPSTRSPTCTSRSLDQGGSSNWKKNTPEEVRSYIDKNITCSIPNAEQSPTLNQLVLKFQSHKCNRYCRKIFKH